MNVQWFWRRLSQCLSTSANTMTISCFGVRHKSLDQKRHPQGKHIRKTWSSFVTRKRMENMTWTRTETIRKHVYYERLIWLRYHFITLRTIPHLWLRRSKETVCFCDGACESHLQSDRSKLPAAMKDSDFFLSFPPVIIAVRNCFAQVNLN